MKGRLWHVGFSYTQTRRSTERTSETLDRTLVHPCKVKSKHTRYTVGQHIDVVVRIVVLQLKDSWFKSGLRLCCEELAWSLCACVGFQQVPTQPKNMHARLICESFSLSVNVHDCLS